MGSISTPPKVERVAVIGAGPGGLAAAKYLLAEKTFTQIDVFEQREDVGGVWCATPDVSADENFTVPHTTPSKIPSNPIIRQLADDTTGDEKIQFISPVYDELDTNIPHTLMNYSDQKFPEGCPLYPPHAMVRQYLEQYADDIRYLLRLGTQVLDVSPTEESGDPSGWSVRTKDLKTQRETTAIYDAVVVANGHYDDPFIPEISGIEAWNREYPNAISHSKFYRRPDLFKDKKVIIVGHSASGIDLAAQISEVSHPPLLISEKTPSTNDPPPGSHFVPEITEFIPQNRSVRLSTGNMETDIDHVIFCTGYMYSFPFLPHHLSPPILSDSGEGQRPENLYEQIFYYPNPTLAFIGSFQRIVPFPVSESQASVIARVFAQRLSLPPRSEMRAWEEAHSEVKGSGKDFQTMACPLDGAYINQLHDWALSAVPRDGLGNAGMGKIPPCWGEEELWIRERFPLLKVAAKKLGRGKRRVTKLEELGFDFGEWKREVAGEKEFVGSV